MERKRLLLIGGSALILVGVTALTVSLFSCGQKVMNFIPQEEARDKLFTLGQENGFYIESTCKGYDEVNEEEYFVDYKYGMKGNIFYCTFTDYTFVAYFGYRLNEDNSMDFFTLNGDGLPQVVAHYDKNSVEYFRSNFNSDVYRLIYEDEGYRYEALGNYKFLDRRTTKCRYTVYDAERGRISRTAYIDKELGIALYYKHEAANPELKSLFKYMEVKKFVTTDVEVPTPLPKNN